MHVLEAVDRGLGTVGFSRSDDMAPADREIHVWFASLECSSPDVEPFAQILSGDEMSRAARFHFERDRRRFVVARGWLRTLLAGYLAATPGDLRFQYGEFGKPQLADAADLRFNLSHADERVLCAVTRGHDVGVDLERIHAVPEMDEIVTRVFSRREQAAYRSVARE